MNSNRLEAFAAPYQSNRFVQAAVRWIDAHVSEEVQDYLLILLIFVVVAGVFPIALMCATFGIMGLLGFKL